MNLLIKGAGFQEGYVMIAGPANGMLRMLEFGRLGVISGRSYEGHTGDREAVFDIISGVCRLEVAGGQTFDSLGGRRDPFSAGPTLICLPPHTGYRFTALSASVDMAVSLTPADPGLPVAILGPNDIPEQRAGAANWSRTIRPGHKRRTGNATPDDGRNSGGSRQLDLVSATQARRGESAERIDL